MVGWKGFQAQQVRVIEFLLGFSAGQMRRCQYGSIAFTPPTQKHSLYQKRVGLNKLRSSGIGDAPFALLNIPFVVHFENILGQASKSCAPASCMYTCYAQEYISRHEQCIYAVAVVSNFHESVWKRNTHAVNVTVEVECV